MRYVEWPGDESGRRLDSVCIRQGDLVQCYELDFAGHCLFCKQRYFGSADLNIGLAVFFGVFDENMTSVSKTDGCFGHLAWVGDGSNANAGIIDTFAFPSGDGRVIAGFDLNRGTATVQLKAGDFDLARAKKLVGIGQYYWDGYQGHYVWSPPASRDGNLSVADLNPIGAQKHPCEYIDEAVIHAGYR